MDKNIYEEWDNKFKSYIEDDLNTANAMTLLYDLLKSDVSSGYGAIYSNRYREMLQMLDDRLGTGMIYIDGGID